MDYDALIESAVREFPHAREFERLFHGAEHSIAKAKRDSDPDGWKIVHEWISRTHMHDRYVIWFVVAIEIKDNGVITASEEPELYLVEVEGGGDSEDEDGQSWKCSISQFEDGVWEELVENCEDFASLGLELNDNAPIDRFLEFWHKTRPNRDPIPPDGMAFRAPIRFLV